MLTIKNLRYVNKTFAFKISDTTTKIKLQGLLGSTPVTFQDADEVSIRIKNNSGYLMQVKPKILSDGIVSFSSKELELLPVGSYAMELWQDNQAGTNIYPSEGFLRFTINKNATEFKGDSMSTITLHNFEERIDKLEQDLRVKADNGEFDGEKGTPGLSAYEVAQENGYTGAEQEWLASLKGKDGAKGEKGEPGNSNINLVKVKDV